SGEPSRAADCYARALAAGGPAADAQAGLARLALARGDLAAARAAVEALLAANPPADVAERARAALARLAAAK
ncbi:MAG: molecular chaperone DnaJ, partial [Candidatus Polarisedimenticolia bacterium]